MTNAKVNDDKAAKDKVLQRVPPHCILVMDRGYCDYGLFKALDEKGVVFVTRLKTNWLFKRTGQGVIDTNYGDFKILFSSLTAIKKVGKDNEFRAVKWYSKEDDRWFVFLTNASDDITAEQVAKLYKDRWQIELFFKRGKQKLKILSFEGTTENAVLVQIWTATITVLLQMYLQKCSMHSWNFSNLVKCIRLNLMTLKDLTEWLSRPDVCSYSDEKKPIWTSSTSRAILRGQIAKTVLTLEKTFRMRVIFQFLRFLDSSVLTYRKASLISGENSSR